MLTKVVVQKINIHTSYYENMVVLAENFYYLELA